MMPKITTLEFISDSIEIGLYIYIIAYIRNVIALFLDYFDKGWFAYEFIEDKYVSTWRFPEYLKAFEKDRIKIWQTPRSWKKLKMCLIQIGKEFYTDLMNKIKYLGKVFSKNKIYKLLKFIFLDIIPSMIYALLIFIWVFGIIFWLNGLVK